MTHRLSVTDMELINAVAAAGGTYVGTGNLVAAVTAAERHAKRCIRDLCQQRILVRKYTEISGRGNLQVYRLQRKSPLEK
jgi:hypothetical protein